MPRRVLGLCGLAALISTVIVTGGQAQVAPPPPPQQSSSVGSGPVTEVSWVGNEIRATGDDGPTQLWVSHYFYATDDNDLYVEFRACSPEQEGEDGEAACASRGRITVGESSGGECRAESERLRDTCGPLQSNRFSGDPQSTAVVIDTGDGDDVVTVTDYGQINLGPGNDTSYAIARDIDHPEVDGGPGDDTLNGGGHGGDGNDVIEGDGDGGPGNDRITGSPQGSKSRGGPGNDILRAAKLRFGEPYRLLGDGGRDRLMGTDRIDSLDGGRGRDFCDGRLPNPGPRGRNRDRNRDRAVRCEVVRNVP